MTNIVELRSIPKRDLPVVTDHPRHYLVALRTDKDGSVYETDRQPVDVSVVMSNGVRAALWDGLVVLSPEAFKMIMAKANGRPLPRLWA